MTAKRNRNEGGPQDAGQKTKTKAQAKAEVSRGRAQLLRPHDRPVILQQKSFQIFREGSPAARRTRLSSSPTAAGSRGDGAAKDVAKIAIGRIVVPEPDGIAAIVFVLVVAHEFPVPGFQRPGMTDVLDQCLRFLEIGIGQPVEADIDGSSARGRGRAPASTV